MIRLRQWVKHHRFLRGTVFCAQNVVSAITPSLVAPPGESGSCEFFLTAMIRVKDEARFMPEWISHHLQIGLEHVFIYDNNSIDGLDEALKPFTDASLVTIIKYPIVPVSPSCYYDFLNKHGHRSKWVAFLDADEFLFERHPGSTVQLLRNVRHPAVALNWRYFGSSWHEKIPEGLVTENFTRADAKLDTHVKVIAQPRLIKRYRNPHNFLYRGGRLARTLDGRRVFGTFVRPAPDPELLIHHYVYRSREDYDRKARRPYGTAVGAIVNVRNPQRSSSEFQRHNEISMTAPPEVIRRTKAALREFRFGPPILAASDSSPGGYEGTLAHTSARPMGTLISKKLGSSKA